MTTVRWGCGSFGSDMLVSLCFVLSEGCPLLEQLNISWCDQVTKDGIQALVRGCGGLKALFLKGCTQVMLCVVLVKVRGTVSSYRFSQDGCPGDSGSWRCYCESTLPKVRTVCLELRTINIWPKHKWGKGQWRHSCCRYLCWKEFLCPCFWAEWVERAVWVFTLPWPAGVVHRPSKCTVYGKYV